MYLTLGCRLAFCARLRSDVYFRRYASRYCANADSGLLDDYGPDKCAKGIVDDLWVGDSVTVEPYDEISQARNITTCENGK
jgi:hypothetical protein